MLYNCAGTSTTLTIGDNMYNEHTHGPNCGCGHGREEGDAITLTLEDDTEVICNVLCYFKIEDIEYVALLQQGTVEVLLYRFKEECGEIDIQNIYSDEEYSLATSAFHDLMDEENKFHE